MRVLVVSPVAPEYVKQIGGTRTYTLGLLNAMRSQSVDARLVGLRGSDSTEGGLVVLDQNTCGSIRFLVQLFWKRSKICRLQPDLVSVQLSIAALAFLFCNIPIVVTMHGSPHKGVAARRGRIAGRVLLFLEGMVLRRAQLLIFVDQATCDEYQAKFPFISHKMRTIPVGVDVNMFKPVARNAKVELRKMVNLPPAAPILVYLGRLSVEKNVAAVVLSFAAFSRHQNDAILLVIGDGPEAESLHEQVDDLKLNNRAVFLKGLAREQIASYLAISDLLVMASRHEGLSIAALEALSCGIPVVSTDVGDLHRLILLHKTGELVRESSELAEVILRAIGTREYPGWAMHAAEHCREVALKFSWESVTKQIIHEYGQVIFREKKNVQ